jgi:hypothetical protein
MSCDDVDHFLGSKQVTRRRQRLSVSPTGRPVLLPNLSPGPTLDEQLGSPEFRDALQAAKENRSNDYPSNRLLQVTLSPDSLLPSHQVTYSYATHDSEDPTMRMQAHVAVGDNLKSPHRFQIIPLHKAKLRVPVQPKPLAVNSAATLSGSTSLDISSYPLQDKLEISHLGNSIVSQQEPRTYDMRKTSKQGRRQSTARQAPENIYTASKLASPGYTGPPSSFLHKSRSLSMSSSLGSTHELASSSSLRDIQIRAASSTNCRRRQTQTPSNYSPVCASSLCPRNSLSSLEPFDSHTNERTREAFVKRRAIYTGSMYLDLPALSDAADRSLSAGDEASNAFAEVSSPSCLSIFSNSGETRTSLRSTRSHREGIPKRRTPLASTDLNVQSESKPTHTKSPLSIFSAPRSSSFLSTDPFASPTMSRIRRRQPETKYHAIVLELFAVLDVAIGEWNALQLGH